MSASLLPARVTKQDRFVPTSWQLCDRSLTCPERWFRGTSAEGLYFLATGEPSFNTRAGRLRVNLTSPPLPICQLMADPRGDYQEALALCSPLAGNSVSALVTETSTHQVLARSAATVSRLTRTDQMCRSRRSLGRSKPTSFRQPARRLIGDGRCGARRPADLYTRVVAHPLTIC